jgi:hypothetical protein
MLQDIEFLNLFTQVLPVFLIIAFILYEQHLIFFSRTALGKITFIILIALYTDKNMLYGLSMCLIVILFYLYTDKENNEYIFSENFVSNTTEKYKDYIPKKALKTKSQYGFYTNYEPTYSIFNKNINKKKVRFRNIGPFEEKYNIEHILRSKITRSNEPIVNIPIQSGNPVVVHKNLVVHKL